MKEYHELEAKAAKLNPDELNAARLPLRPDEEKQATLTLKKRYGDSYDPAVMQRAKDKTTNLLREESALVKLPYKAPKQKQGKEWER